MEKAAIFILGMHRSGTSLLAGVLKNYGLYLGDVAETSLHNKKGNQENQIARSLNIELMKANHSSWQEPVIVNNIPPITSTKIKLFCEMMNKQSDRWGIKDPRMLFCLNAWENQAKVFVGTVRHPSEVVKSLVRRNEYLGKKARAFNDWEELWFKYNLQLLYLYKEHNFPIIDFNWNAERYKEVVRKIALKFGLHESSNEFYDDELIHENSVDEILNPKISDLYEELLDITKLEEKKLLAY